MMRCMLATTFITLITFATANAGTIELTWMTVDGGGVDYASGGPYEVSGTIGQPDAGVMTGGNIELRGGFWASAPATVAPLDGDFDNDGDVDLSDFAQFSLCFGGANVPPAASCPPGIDADFDEDGDVDLSDFAEFALNYTGPL